MTFQNRLAPVESIVSTMPEHRNASRVRNALDAAIVAVGEQHPKVWPFGLINQLAREHETTPQRVWHRRRQLLPGAKSARGKYE